MKGLALALLLAAAAAAAEEDLKEFPTVESAAVLPEKETKEKEVEESAPPKCVDRCTGQYGDEVSKGITTYLHLACCCYANRTARTRLTERWEVHFEKAIEKPVAAHIWLDWPQVEDTRLSLFPPGTHICIPFCQSIKNLFGPVSIFVPLLNHIFSISYSPFSSSCRAARAAIPAAPS